MDFIVVLIVRFMVICSGMAKLLSFLGIISFDRWTVGKKCKLLLVGYNGARNTGADARVVGIVRQLKQLYNPEQIEITVMTLNKATLQGYFDEDVNLLEFSSIFFWDLFKACSSHHAAILCEGSTLKSTFADSLTLFFIEASGIMAKQKKPCIAYGSEVGEMSEYLNKLSSKLCKDTYFITRTQPSYVKLDNLGLSGHVGTDTAWRYRQDISDDAVRKMLVNSGWNQRDTLLGLAVINPFCWPVRPSLAKWIKSLITGDYTGSYNRWYYFSDSEKRQEAFQSYLNALANGVQAIAKEEKIFLVIIGMEQLDTEACHSFSEKINIPHAIFTSKEYTANELTGIVRNLSSLITSRYHAAVLSIQKKIPIIGISMDERIRDLFTELDFQNDYLFTVDNSQLDQGIINAYKKSKDTRSSIFEALEISQSRYEAKFDDMGIFLKNYLTRQLGMQ